MRNATADPVMEATTPVAPGEFRWTADRFYRAAAAGVFDDPGRLELIHGRIIEKMPQSPVHASSRRRIARLLRERVSPSLYVCEESPVHIAFDGEPVPDIVVLRGAEREYDERHPVPEDVALLVEVAVSSIGNDLGEKALLYAQAGVVDYWFTLAEEGAILVHRDPTPQGYGSVTRLDGTATISPLAASESAFAVRDFLGASG